MNTKPIMIASAAFCAVIGLSMTFAPIEMGNLLTPGWGSTASIFIQLMGALFFAFAILNWMAKGSIIGGIYNKPISLANFTHFFIGALALLKASKTFPPGLNILWVATALYIIFAVLFGLISFRHPAAAETAA